MVWPEDGGLRTEWTGGPEDRGLHGPSARFVGTAATSHPDGPNSRPDRVKRMDVSMDTHAIARASDARMRSSHNGHLRGDMRLHPFLPGLANLAALVFCVA